MMTAFDALACPLDGAPLHREGSAWRCASGHSFDIASQGYTHLLPVQNKRSRDPGDSKAMIAARRRFLGTDVYRPVAQAVALATLQGLDANRVASCLDAGCGEGYYLRELARAAGDQALAVLGLDISKWAVMVAARQDKDPNWVVGSNANLPVQSATLDRLLCIFGFPVYAEFARVLKPSGQLIQVDAGPDHLRELREIIYPSLKPARPADAAPPDGFVLRPTETTRYSITLDSSLAIADLLVMTPHLYRANAESRARAMALPSLSLTVDVRIARLARA